MRSAHLSIRLISCTIYQLLVEFLLARQLSIIFSKINQQNIYILLIDNSKSYSILGSQEHSFRGIRLLHGLHSSGHQLDQGDRSRHQEPTRREQCVRGQRVGQEYAPLDRKTNHAGRKHVHVIFSFSFHNYKKESFNKIKMLFSYLIVFIC